MERRTDARKVDKDAVEAVSGTGRIEDGVVAGVRCESSDDPQVSGREAVGARPIGREGAVHGAASGGTDMVWQYRRSSG